MNDDDLAVVRDRVLTIRAQEANPQVPPECFELTSRYARDPHSLSPYDPQNRAVMAGIRKALGQ